MADIKIKMHQRGYIFERELIILYAYCDKITCFGIKETSQNDLKVRF